MNGSGVTTHGARGAGNKRAFWSDGAGWCRWCSIAHFDLCQKTGTEVNDPYFSLLASLLYLRLLLGVFLLLGASLLFEFRHQKWSIDIFPWFPGVVGTQIPFPANEVLILRSPRPHVQYFLHFPLRHPFN